MDTLSTFQSILILCILILQTYTFDYAKDHPHSHKVNLIIMNL